MPPMLSSIGTQSVSWGLDHWSRYEGSLGTTGHADKPALAGAVPRTAYPADHWSTSAGWVRIAALVNCFRMSGSSGGMWICCAQNIVSGSGIALRRPEPSWKNQGVLPGERGRGRANRSAWGARETRLSRGSGAGVPGPEFRAWPGPVVWGCGRGPGFGIRSGSRI